MVGFSAANLGGDVHFILQLGDFVCKFLQGLHDAGSLLGFHSSVLLQVVYQGLKVEEQMMREEMLNTVNMLIFCKQTRETGLRRNDKRNRKRGGERIRLSYLLTLNLCLQHLLLLLSHVLLEF